MTWLVPDGWADSGAVVGVVAGDTGTTSSGGVGGRIDGDYGYLTLNADGSYVYVSPRQIPSPVMKLRCLPTPYATVTEI